MGGDTAHRWRLILAERVAETVRLVTAVDGVDGLVVGGSVGRGEAWPLSDIDVLPVYRDGADATRCREGVARVQAELVDWWAASGRAQCLDLSWLGFTADELTGVVAAGVEGLAARMADPRWFHGVDKAYGGRPGDPQDRITRAFLDLLDAHRFAPVVVAARVARWRAQAAAAAVTARSAADGGDPGGATVALREAARALRLVLVEGWGERLGSMGREWTGFERIAARHGADALAARIAAAAGADPAEVAARAGLAPAWLAERIDLALAGRRLVGEQVTPEQNARDQIAAFTVHVLRHRPDLDGSWTAVPDPRLGPRLAEVERLLGELAADRG